MNTHAAKPLALLTALAMIASGVTPVHGAERRDAQPASPAPNRPVAQPDGTRKPSPHRPSTAPDYIRVHDAKGVIRSVGSSTVSGLINEWASAFTALHPGASVDVSGGGSSTAPPALLSGTCDIAPMSRPMNDSELARFKQTFGYEPLQIVVAVDALAVFVHKDNPVSALSLTQLDAMFSATRKRGGSPVDTWGDLGLTGEWAHRPVQLYGFGDLTGGYALFRDLVLDGGEYSAAMKAEPGSSAIVSAAGAYRGAVGFASQYFATARTRMVPIIGEDGKPHEPTEASCLDGSYPLARRLFIYINKKPDQPLPPNTAEFLRYALSRQGQTAAADAGMFAVPGELASQQIQALDR
jgi:phosphate transport system substrate-binding protein